MKTKFELGEDVLLNVRIIRIGFARDNNGRDKVAYDLVVTTVRGDRLSINAIDEDDLKHMVQI